MKIIGIGTDLVWVPRIQRLLQRHGDRAAAKILGDQEYLGYKNAANPIAFLAKRFAAKEAVAKAFGSGFRHGLSLRHIQVANDAAGKPLLQFTEQALVLCEQYQVSQSFISLTDDGDYAGAYVILSGDG
ncbi:Holo-(acyl-carrier protein) synthase [Methylophaga frappieri]|uniref:Holo-[acyl-carrier-protein] synthase n=1 Tax=Methylophaga frappieri (strain ATCC BAA-2434 / DSM 25690 / JAM7) TaxID=754477 RepID=I1YF96_METFJ|nr:holo-ACP synthase [Methylophaga frappieri]AFJ01589.1 Holo-(acyl-carrier protein) synthase [Methylophaga frappieri]